MKMHLCERCGKSFKILSKLREHNNRQTPCRPATHHCSTCGKGFSGYQSLWKHRQRCLGVREENKSIDPNVDADSDTNDVDIENEGSKIVTESEDIIALDAWKIIMHRADDGKMTRLLDSFKYFVQVCEGFVRDIAYRKVIQTARKIKEENNDMDFDDALDCAMDKRKSLIFTTAIEAMSRTASKDNEEQ